MKRTHIVTIVIALLVSGAIGYALGKATIQKTGTSANPERGGFAQGPRAGRSMQGGMIAGTILERDAESMVIETRGGGPNGAGGSRIVFLSGSTQITKSATGTVSDLTAGTMVSVFGTTNPDGSVSAQSVQIRPEGRRASSSPL